MAEGLDASSITDDDIYGGRFRETSFGPIPCRWPISLLSDCAEVQTGVTKGRTIDPADSIELPYLRVANVQDGYLDLSEIKQITVRRSEVARFSLKVGDVVLTEGGDFDKLGRGFLWNGEVFGCLHQNHIFAVRPNQAVLTPEFLAYLTQKPLRKEIFSIGCASNHALGVH
ncbi:MAG TPA: hypothetical protein VE959_04550 [Bryobacteraceae bacterium]|nr:hypothetical protein [Bryobacteraceae bacterium]